MAEAENGLICKSMNFKLLMAFLWSICGNWCFAKSESRCGYLRMLGFLLILQHMSALQRFSSDSCSKATPCPFCWFTPHLWLRCLWATSSTKTG